MTDDNRDAPTPQDEDRLPWLEAVDDEDGGGGSAGKLIGFGIAALVAIGVVVGGVTLLRQNDPALKGDGKLIAAQQGDYKVRPDAPGGMKVEGQGDSAFAASEGAEANGKIDLNSTPETPVEGSKVPKAGPSDKVAAGSAVSEPMPAKGAKLVAAAPAKPVKTASAAPGGSLIQLGAFDSEAQANGSWVSLSKRFAYLAPLNKSVATAVVGGKTYYRLRADAGADARTVCGKLKVAGENCLVVE